MRSHTSTPSWRLRCSGVRLQISRSAICRDQSRVGDAVTEIILDVQTVAPEEHRTFQLEDDRLPQIRHRSYKARSRIGRETSQDYRSTTASTYPLLAA